MFLSPLNCTVHIHKTVFSVISTGPQTNTILQKQPTEVFCKKRCSYKFYKNSQENTCTRVSFLKFKCIMHMYAKYETMKKPSSCKHKYANYNTSDKFWVQSPSPHSQCCLQVSETVSWHKLRCCYSANMLQDWVGGRGLIYFWKVDHSRIFIHFSRNWLGASNLCEIL